VICDNALCDENCRFCAVAVPIPSDPQSGCPLAFEKLMCENAIANIGRATDRNTCLRLRTAALKACNHYNYKRMFELPVEQWPLCEAVNVPASNCGQFPPNYPPISLPPGFDPAAPQACWDDHDDCYGECNSRFPSVTPIDQQRRNACYLDCDAEFDECIERVTVGVIPIDRTHPECDEYDKDDTYAGANARCFCRCAGNSPWSRYVRGCLRMMYKAGVDPSTAHWTCYKAASSKGYDRPEMTLAYCYALCAT